MRILHISTRLILGGSQENTVLSCEGQARRGHDVHLAFGPIFGPEGSMLDRVRAFRTPDGRTPDGRTITTHELRHLRREVSPWHDHFCFHHDLKRLIARVQPDVVHTHSSKAGILGRWAAWLARPRPAVVHTIHGPPFMPVEGGALACSKRRASNAAYTLAERFAARRCHTIVSVADAMTEQFRARRIGRPEQYVTVRSGMELDPYLHAAPGEDRASVRAALGIGAEEFVLGTVARLAEHKGHDDVLDALGDELRARPRWRLLWVGDGWWRARLEQRLAAMGLRDRVTLTGLVGPERIPGLMRAMDVLIHPSYREGLPRTVPQALLCSVPVVASDCDGTREACLDPARVGAERATGRLFAVGDVSQLREAVVWMAEHEPERRAMGQRGREFAAEEFGAEKMVEELERVYERATALARPQHA